MTDASRLNLARSILAVPPFPRAKPHPVITTDPARQAPPGMARLLIEAIRAERVGGDFWDVARDPWTVGAEADSLLDRLVSDRSDEDLEGAVDQALLNGLAYHDPFTGEPSDPLALVAQLGHWRRLIETNQSTAAAFGFARWKQDTVEPLLWNGANGPAFSTANAGTLHTLPAGSAVAVWKARVSPEELAEIEQRFAICEVEDGFIRSVGLGADCVPPLSIVVDDLGVHYDPARPNRLEQMIEAGGFPAGLITRAGELRRLIVRNGIGKYGIGAGGDESAQAVHTQGRRIVLVVGQVEDDRSVRFGSPVVRSNLALLEAAHAMEPDAHIIYRPHPDVTAGHRTGAIPRAEATRLADEIDADTAISDLLARSDALHTMTSLAGFEALLRGREVICHGLPFYAGWGLTRDLAGTLPRRTARPTIDELAAAVLLLYPRYLDPVTNLPCTPEILIMRLMAGIMRQNGALVPARRLQGILGRAAARMSKSI